MGGGGNSQGPGGSGAGDAKDESKPSPAAPASPDAFGDTVAPQGQPQGELTLRKLHEALQDDQSAKLLEERTGIPREQLEQFAKSYEKVKSGPAAPRVANLEVKSANTPRSNPARTFRVSIGASGSAPRTAPAEIPCPMIRSAA